MRYTMFSMIMAAGLTAAAVYGQEAKFEAKVNFAFRTANASMPASEYHVSMLSGLGAIRTIRIADTVNRNAVLATARVEVPFKGVVETSPHMLFKCPAGSACYLSELVNDEGTKWVLTAPKISSAEKERAVAVVVPLSRSGKAD
jgi:hypothetical protein